MKKHQTAQTVAPTSTRTLFGLSKHALEAVTGGGGVVIGTNVTKDGGVVIGPK